MADEKIWRRRFLLYMGARLFGILTFFAGIAIVYTDVLRDGGWPQVGAVIAIAGLIDAFVAPRLIKRQWERE